MEKQSLFTMYTQGVSLAKLTEGEHSCIIAGHSFVENKEDASKCYIRLELTLEDRTIVDNRFEQGFNVFLSQVKEQLGMSDVTIGIPELLNRLMKKEFKCWITYFTVDGKTYRNVNYLPPIEKKAPETQKPEIYNVGEGAICF